MVLLRRHVLWASVVAASVAAASAALADGAKRKPPAGPPPPTPGSFEAVIANNPISAILKGQKLWTTPEEPEDWVKATRPAEMSFMPVGVTPPNHATKVKTAAELAAATADLEAARAALDQRAATPVLPTPPAAPVAAPPAPAHKKPLAARARRPKPPVTAAASPPD